MPTGQFRRDTIIAGAAFRRKLVEAGNQVKPTKPAGPGDCAPACPLRSPMFRNIDPDIESLRLR
jgi:hypothetical protein